VYDLLVLGDCFPTISVTRSTCILLRHRLTSC
jgi:hypothetical protein